MRCRCDLTLNFCPQGAGAEFQETPGPSGRGGMADIGQDSLMSAVRLLLVGCSVGTRVVRVLLGCC